MVSMSSIASNVSAAEPQFNHLWGVAVDSSGNVYVADTGNDRVQKFTNTGTFIRKWGSFCDVFGGNVCNGQFDGPRGIAVDSSGNVFVGDTGNDRIQKFSNTGNFIRKWGTSGSGNSQFGEIEGVAVDSSGNVFVADGHPYIQKFSNTGTFIKKWGGPGQFSEPSYLAVDRRSGQQNVFVADFDNHNIQKFSNSGTFIKKWGSNGGSNGQFRHPEGVAVDSSGNVFVADTYNHRIQKFSNTGTFIRKWGSLGTGNGQFEYPNGIAVDKSGNVFVADTDNDRIQKFSNTGTFIKKWGTSGSVSLSSASEKLPNASGGEQLNTTGTLTNSTQNAKSIDRQDETASQFPSVLSTYSSQNNTQDESASEFP
jgi:tripartite motif-containing protein 71